MAFTKIQPQQLQLPIFLSPSGDLAFADNTTGFNIDLNRSLTGDFNIEGNLTVSSNEVVTSNGSNSSDSNGKALGGISNTATGQNVVVNGMQIDANSGQFNTALNGKSFNFGQSGEYNTVVCGRNISFADQMTGSVVIADQVSTAQNITKNNSLLISFDSGVEFRTPSSGVVFSDDAVFNDEVYFNGVARSANDSNADGANFNVSTTSKSITEYAYRVDRSGGTVGGIRIDGAADFGDLVVSGNLRVSGSMDTALVLVDSSEAASQAYVDERVGFSINHAVDNALTTELESYSAINVANLENVITGNYSSQAVVTGHILTGTSVAYFVVEGENFTGAIPFPANSFEAI